MTIIAIDTPEKEAAVKDKILSVIAGIIDNNPSEYHIELRVGLYTEMLMLQIDTSNDTPMIDAIASSMAITKTAAYNFVAALSLSERQLMSGVITKQINDLNSFS